MARLLVLAIAAALAVLAAPPGKQLMMMARAARPSPAEAFWRAALPDAPMPEAIRELLHPSAAGTKDPNVGDPPPLPPLNFKYDDYKSSPRNEAAAAAVEGVVSEHGEEAVAAAIECRVGRARPGGGRAAFRLVDVKKPGGAAVVCHAVPGGAQGLPVKTGGESPSLA